jgi:hypothetical protein
VDWLTLTTDDVLALFNDSETSAYEQAKGEAAGTTLAAAVTAVVNELREAISGRDITLGPDGTIPSGFKKRAIGAARYEFLNALPTGKSLLNEERVKANAVFEKLIEGIQEGKIHVTSAVGLSATALPAIKSRPQHMKLRDQEGL